MSLHPTASPHSLHLKPSIYLAGLYLYEKLGLFNCVFPPLLLWGCKSCTPSSCLALWPPFLHALPHPHLLDRADHPLAPGPGCQTWAGARGRHDAALPAGRLVIQAACRTRLPCPTPHPCPSSNSPRPACLPSAGQRREDRRETRQAHAISAGDRYMFEPMPRDNARLGYPHLA